ncbi:MAG: hypothetical protein JNL80_00275 [Phycisphaerae bacterium]|nr:hypothetical protein [Phycisphaerae bacterium]
MSHWSFVATVATASMLAASTASFAGDPCSVSANDCCIAGVGPGCSDSECCNAVCAVDFFCCSVEWDGNCASESAAICVGCGAGSCIVDCNRATTEEVEPCGADLNGGCNDVIKGAVSFADVGDIICGNYWADGSTRDTDWYEFSLSENKVLSFSVTGEIPTTLFVLSGGCPASILASATTVPGACDPAIISDLCLVTGTYRVFVAPSDFVGTPCDVDAGYLLSIIDTGNVCTSIPGDTCEDALPVIEGLNPVSTLGAFTGGDPLPEECLSFGSVTMFNDTWYVFTASQSGLYRISTCDLVDFDSRLALYSGECDNLTFLACNDDGGSCGGFTSEMLTNLEAGVEYRVRLGGFGATASGSGDLLIEPFVGCDIACPEGGVPEAELCGEDLNGGCNGGGTYEDIATGTSICGTFWADGSTRDTDWYRFNLAEASNVTMTVHANIDVTIGILSATCDPVIYVIEVQPGCGATLSFCLPAGDNVAFVAPASFSSPPCGSGILNDYVLTVDLGDACVPITCGSPETGDCCVASATPYCNDEECCSIVCGLDPWCCSNSWDGICADEAADFCALCAVDPPANDECPGAPEIFDGETEFSTLGATTSPPALDPACDEGFGTAFVQDIWYSYTATCDGTVNFSTCGTVDFDTRLALYSGDCDNLVLVACNDDGLGCPGFSSSMDAELSKGITYLLRIGGFSGDGTGTINISCGGGGGGIENDECADALVVNLGANGFTNVGATGVTVLAAECISAGSVNVNNDIWYTYTATATGLATISTCGAANFDTRLAAFTGACDDLTLVACNEDASGCTGFTSIMTFAATCGETYTILVGAFGAAGFGTGTITVSQDGTCPSPCLGDLNDDGQVGAVDLALLLGAWGTAGGPADLNNNGLVAAEDLALLLGAWGDCP